MSGEKRSIEISELVRSARAVVDIAPGYTARGGSIWILDHAMDELRDALARWDAAAPRPAEPERTVRWCDTHNDVHRIGFEDDSCRVYTRRVGGKVDA